MPDAYISPEGTGKLLWLTKTIHEWLLRSFHPLVQNAVQKLKKVKKYITGLLPEKYFAWNVAKFHIASSGHQQPTKMLIIDMVHAHIKNSRGFSPLFLSLLKDQTFRNRQRNSCYTQIPCKGIDRQSEKSRVWAFRTWLSETTLRARSIFQPFPK